MVPPGRWNMMDSKQLMDSLADHLALYHSFVSASVSPASNSQSHKNILRWMSTLSTEQRQATLTTVDDSMVAILLQMQTCIQKHGLIFFILLPDVPVKNKVKPQHRAIVDVALPSLCYRKAKGLLARANSDNQAERTLTDSLRLFSSMEGQTLVPESFPLDSLSVAEDLPKDVDRFVCVMDTISDGKFLISKGTFVDSKCNWEELSWLKAKGYYSLATFVTNKLELSLRLSWLNSRAKKLGCSWIKGNKMVHAFCVGDRSHPQAQEIYAKLEKMSWEMKVAGYFSDSEHVLSERESKSIPLPP